MADDERDFSTGFAERLDQAIGNMSQAVVAKRADVSTSGLSKWLQGTEPGLFKAARLSKVLEVNLNWLASGDGTPNAAADGHVSVPIFDVRLAAGVAKFSEAARVIGQMPFDLNLLRQLGLTSAEDLGVLESEGDSMEPIIPDGARVLVNFKDVRMREKIFAFRLDDELRIKRLRRVSDGIEVLSENPRYGPELLSGAALERFAIIGRVLLTASLL